MLVVRHVHGLAMLDASSGLAVLVSPPDVAVETLTCVELVLAHRG